METLQIIKENAIKAYKEADIKGKQLLINLFDKTVFLKNITERVKTFDDALVVLGLNKEKFDDSIKDLSKDEVAYKKLKIINKALNEGWTPNWDDSDEYKYYPWFKKVGSGAGFSYYDYFFDYSYSLVGSSLVFKSSELAKYAGQQFIDIYNDFLTL